jgi:hypothetical protein
VLLTQCLSNLPATLKIIHSIFLCKAIIMSRSTDYETSNYPPSDDSKFIRYISYMPPRR